MERELVNHIVKYSLEYSNDKLGEVLEQTSTSIKCRELLKPEDIKGKIYLGGRHVFCGDKELYRTTSIIEISKSQIKDVYPRCTLQDYHGTKGYLLRQTYDPITHQFHPELTKVCLCLEYLNPDLEYFICSLCTVTFHYTCVGETCPNCKLPIKRQSSDQHDLDSPTKIPKNSSRHDSTLPLDVEKYKSLSDASKKYLIQQIKNLHLSYLAMQGSLNHEEKTRQQIITKIKCALFLAAEEIKQCENLEYNMQTIETIAISVEAAIYFSTGSKVTSQEYSKKIRSVIFNLSAEKNPDFRGDILKGYIDPKDLCKMQSKDMASSEIKNFRQERQKVYTKEQLILPNSSEKLVIKTHKGEAVFNVNDKVVSDEFSTDILDSLLKKRDVEAGKTDDDDPFDPNTYESADTANGVNVDTQFYELVKEWTPQAITQKIHDGITQHLTPSQASSILSRINSFSLNKST
jgi:Transcription factor S-II (TFIIS), central domain